MKEIPAIMPSFAYPTMATAFLWGQLEAKGLVRWPTVPEGHNVPASRA